jgi:predicted ATPase
MLGALKRLILREAQQQPVILVFEDLHWIDSETQAFLEALIDGLASAPILLILTYRPEYAHHWGSKTNYTQLRLDALPPEAADAYLRSLLGDDTSLVALKRSLQSQRNRGQQALDATWVYRARCWGTLARPFIAKATQRPRA